MVHSVTAANMHSEHITDAQWQEMETDMMGLVDAAMQSTPHTREADAIQNGFHLISEKHSMRMFVKKTPASAFHEFLALRRSPLTLDEYMELSYCDTTEALRTQQALFYRDNLLNATVLASHQTRSADNSQPFRYVGLKYKRLRFAISGGMFEPRDSTYVEVSGLRTNKAGQRVLFIARESLNLDDYPPVDHVVRFHFKTLILQTQCDDYIEEAVFLMSNPLGSIPAFVFNKVTQTSLYLVDDFPLMLQKMRLLRAMESRPPPKKQSEFKKLKECCACRARFQRFRSPHDCVACGYAMCGKCVVTIPRVVPGTLNSMSVVHDDVCKQCFVSSARLGNGVGGTFISRSSQSSQCSIDSYYDDDDSRDSAGLRSTVSTGNDLEQDGVLLDYLAEQDTTAGLERMQLGIEQQRHLVQQMMEQMARRQSIEDGRGCSSTCKR